MTNLCIFVSGSGTNCENLIRHFAESDEARVRLVVSNKPNAFALERPRKNLEFFYEDYHKKAEEE